MMRARFDRGSGLWEVREGKRWWTVSASNNAIFNEKLQPIKPNGELGKRILRAVAEAQCRGSHPHGHVHRI